MAPGCNRQPVDVHDEMETSGEFSALQALYCKPGECSLRDDVITINTTVEVDGVKLSPGASDESTATVGMPASVSFYVSKCPRQIDPGVSIRCDCISREAAARIKEDAVVTYDESDESGEALVLELMMVIQAGLEREVKCTIQTDVDTQTQADKSVMSSAVNDSPLISSLTNTFHKKDSLCTCVIRIDHMRSKKKYCKMLEKWSNDLSLTGRLLFCPKYNILLILQGCPADIKKFNVRLKTTSVDVDSRGHSCKERMSSILCEEISDFNRFAGFQEEEFSKEAQTEAFFSDAGLKDIYDKFICI